MSRPKRRGQGPSPVARRPPGSPPAPVGGTRLTAYWPVAAFTALLVLALVGLYLYSRGTAPVAQPVPAASAASVVDAVTHLDPAQTGGLGAAGVKNPMKPIHGAPPLTGPNGHPQVLYIGAEYCPYCAAERWSLAVALSRFGNLSGVGLTQSSSSDIYPNTPTLTFAHASFQGTAVEFEAVETQDRERRPLQPPTAAHQRLLQAYDPQGSIPFIDIGNRQTAVGAGYLPDLLQGLSWEQVARNLADLASPLTRQILGNANWITAAICQAAGDGAAPACSIPAIKSLEGQLGS